MRARRISRVELLSPYVVAVCVLATTGGAIAQQEAPNLGQPSDQEVKTPIAAEGGGSPGASYEPKAVKVEEMVVTAPRLNIPVSENPAATSIVGEEVLSQMPRGVGAEEALWLVPGLRVENQADGERVHLSIRGQGLLTERGIRGINVLLDGIPLNDPTGFAPDLFDVDWDNVERVEVLRGPASALYGGGSAGGVINIVTKDGGAKSVTGDGSFVTGSYDFYKVRSAAGGTEGQLNYRADFFRDYGNGYRTHTQFDSLNGYSKVHWSPSPNLSITGILSGTKYFNENAEGLNQAQVDQDPTQANPDALKYNEYQRTQRITGGVNAHLDLGVHEVSVTAFYRNTWWKESVPSSLDNRTYYAPGLMAQYTLHHETGSIRNRFSLGSDVNMQWFRDKRDPNPAGGQAGPVLSNQWIEQIGFAFFALDLIELPGGFGIMGGVRYDQISNSLTDDLRANGVDLSGSADFSKTTGRVGIFWNPDPRAGLYANWGQGFLPPATEELANNPDALGGFNTHIVPATSEGEEIGVRGDFDWGLAYSAAFYHLHTDNDFGRYRVATRPLETFYQNAGSSRRYGVESSVLYQPMPNFLLDLAYTYSDFIYTHVNSLFGDFTDTRMPNSPIHQVAGNAQYVWNQHWVLGVGFYTSSGWWVDQSHSLSSPGYTLMSAQAAYRWTGTGYRGELSVSGRNILGEKYIAFSEPDPDGNSFHPGPTEEVFGGVKLWFD
jgi:iron complex outermembrane receptor protein